MDQISRTFVGKVMSFLVFEAVRLTHR